ANGANPSSFIVSDTSFPSVRLVATNQVITTIAGDGSGGDVGNGQPAAIAAITTKLTLGFSIVQSPSGFVLADSRSNAIRSIDAATTVLSTVAGNGGSGVSPDGAAAPAANVGLPLGL